jgi:hypothetical protein
MLGLAWTAIVPFSAFCIGRVTGVTHQAWLQNFEKFYNGQESQCHFSKALEWLSFFSPEVWWFSSSLIPDTEVSALVSPLLSYVSLEKILHEFESVLPHLSISYLLQRDKEELRRDDCVYHILVQRGSWMEGIGICGCFGCFGWQWK